MKTSITQQVQGILAKAADGIVELEWEHADADDEWITWVGDGFYMLLSGDWCRIKQAWLVQYTHDDLDDDIEVGTCNSLDGAKALAQADWDARRGARFKQNKTKD